MQARRTLYVYDGDVSVLYEPRTRHGDHPLIRLSQIGRTEVMTIAGRQEIEQLTDALVSIRADMAIRRSDGTIAKEVANHGD